MKNSAKKSLLLLLGLSLLAFSQLCIPLSMEEETVFAALGLNIVRFTTWPPEVQPTMKVGISLCVVGDNVVQQAFAGIDNKAIGNNTLHIVNMTRLRNLEQCHILYISELEQNALLHLFSDIKKRPLLTIGEGSDFATQGGMIGLQNEDGKIAMYINLPVVRESNLNISARLLKLAKIIDN